MNRQAINNCPDFCKELRKTATCSHIACDPEAAADISLKLNKAAKAIEDLKAQLEKAEAIVAYRYNLLDNGDYQDRSSL